MARFGPAALLARVFRYDPLLLPDEAALAALLAPARYRLSDRIGHDPILGGEAAEGLALVVLARQAGDEVALGSIGDQLFEFRLEFFHLSTPPNERPPCSIGGNLSRH